MNAYIPGSGPDSIDSAATTYSPPAEIVSVDVAGAVPPELTPRFPFAQHVIPLDSSGQSLRMLQDTELQINVLSKDIEVVGWGIRMPSCDVGNLPREMGRQYLMLWSRSERGVLQPEEQALWNNIVDSVDFQEFCNDRAPYLYAEGEVISRTREETRIRWANGREEAIRGKLGRAFDMVEIGELFSASVKQERNDKLRSIENVTILGKADVLLREVEDDWIRKI